MKLKEIKEAIDAELLTEEHFLSVECNRACCSDLMSDVLAFSKAKCVLMTGLVNIQVVRTAEMMDIKAIIFVRGKMPGKELIELAESKNIAVLTTKKTMFEASGILYLHGLGREEG